MALSGGAIYTFDSRFFTLTQNFFVQNKALKTEPFACFFVNGAGGAIFLNVLQQISIMNCSFIENSADLFGGALGFFQVGSSSAKFAENRYEKSIARYGSNIGSLPQYLKMWVVDTTSVFSRENFYVHLEFEDALNNSASVESCSLLIDSEFSEILQIYP
jgi:hypothetical protein